MDVTIYQQNGSWLYSKKSCIVFRSSNETVLGSCTALTNELNMERAMLFVFIMVSRSTFYSSLSALIFLPQVHAWISCRRTSRRESWPFFVTFLIRSKACEDFEAGLISLGLSRKLEAVS